MRTNFTTTLLGLAAGLTTFAAPGHAQTDLDGDWHVLISSNHYGALESVIELARDDDGWDAETRSIGLSLVGSDDDNLHGLLSVDGGDDVTFNASVGPDGHIDFDVASGPLAGHWELTSSNTDTLDRDFPALYGTMSAIMENWVYDSRLLSEQVYVDFLSDFATASGEAEDDIDLILGFSNSWDGSLFSHFEILRPLDTMDGLLETADQAAEERPVAYYESLSDDIALVTIESFFGLAIETQIDGAMNDAIESGASNLIIDVRENGGGTTSAIPVGARIFQDEMVLGYFLANSWWKQNDSLPTQADFEGRAIMNNRDRGEMMGELVQTGMVAARVAPVAPGFDGDVYLLISERSGSATEALVGMIKMSGRATLVGETTAGSMLNSNFFPLPNDFTLRVPLADFYLSDNTRIDGIGVTPDVEIADEDALDEALRLIAAAH